MTAFQQQSYASSGIFCKNTCFILRQESTAHRHTLLHCRGLFHTASIAAEVGNAMQASIHVLQTTIGALSPIESMRSQDKSHRSSIFIQQSFLFEMFNS